MHKVGNKPPRFEDEYPEEAEVFMKLCSDKEYREKVQWEESRLPRSERLYPHINDLQLGILGWKHGNFKSKPKEGTFVRSAPKVSRNDPCPCGSGKKFKKCCIMK